MTQRLYLLAALTLVPLNFASAEKQTEWFQCSDDTHCLITSNNCGEFSAVNRKFLTEYHVWLEDSDDNCPKKERSRKGPVRITCDSSRCKAAVNSMPYTRARLKSPHHQGHKISHRK